MPSFPASRSRCARIFFAALLAAFGTPGATRAATTVASPGLLFYLSADQGTTADIAAPGTAEPTFIAEVTPIQDGATIRGRVKMGKRVE